MKALAVLLLCQAVPLARPPILHATVTVQPMNLAPSPLGVPPVPLASPYCPFDGQARAVLVAHHAGGYQIIVLRWNGQHVTTDLTSEETDILVRMKQ